MYKGSDKICELMSHEEDAIQIISRFGLEMGVGEQTIEQVCEAHGVHTPTFLAIVNYKVFHQRVVSADIDIPTLQRYLLHAHAYFLDFRLPRLRRALIEAIIPADPTTKIPGLILRCYDEFVDEIRTHIEHENAGLFDEHEHDDQRITDKLTEIKNLIIKYYPGTSSRQTGGVASAEKGDSLITYTLISVMSDLWHTEQDFSDHCAIEDDILRPALSKTKDHFAKKQKTAALKDTSEELSDRERDVLIQVVRGLSNKEIADVLCISMHTVISHRKHITHKLNIHSTAGLTVYAIVNKLVDINTLE
jgi:regulator of cell morphogenesis and NO signaling